MIFTLSYCFHFKISYCNEQINECPHNYYIIRFLYFSHMNNGKRLCFDKDVRTLSPYGKMILFAFLEHGRIFFEAANDSRR